MDAKDCSVSNAGWLKRKSIENANESLLFVLANRPLGAVFVSADEPGVQDGRRKILTSSLTPGLRTLMALNYVVHNGACEVEFALAYDLSLAKKQKSRREHDDVRSMVPCATKARTKRRSQV